MLTPTSDGFERAKGLLAHRRTGLRAGDALHLAIASRREIELIYSLDQGLLRAGTTLNVTASDAGILPVG